MTHNQAEALCARVHDRGVENCILEKHADELSRYTNSPYDIPGVHVEKRATTPRATFSTEKIVGGELLTTDDGKNGCKLRYEFVLVESDSNKIYGIICWSRLQA